MARTGFHPAPGVDVSDADAGVGDVKDPKTFYSVAAPKKTGTMPTQTLNPANEDVTAGYYAETTLSAVDGDLAEGNIKQGETIFGFAGTVTPGGVETIEKYSNAVIADGATYTPGDGGIFFSGGRYTMTIEYYSTADTTWHQICNITRQTGATAIGDGTNFRIVNNIGNPFEYCLMRHYFSTGTYERARDEQLAATTAWTPGDAGFFSTAVEAGDSAGSNICQQLQYTGAGWVYLAEAKAAQSEPATITIGDGTNYRVYNYSAGALYHITMRAVMT